MVRRPLLILTLLAALLAVPLAMAAGSSAAPSPAGASAARAAAPATRVVHVRPVTDTGRPAPGWTVTRESGEVSCSGSSPSAVDPGIAGCYPTAYAFVACFRSSGHTVLCLRDATKRALVRIRYTGTYPRTVDAPARPTPAYLAPTAVGARSAPVAPGALPRRTATGSASAPAPVRPRRTAAVSATASTSGPRPGPCGCGTPGPTPTAARSPRRGS